MTRRSLLGAVVGGVLWSLWTPIMVSAYTVRQLVRACRLWLKRHHVKGYATVDILTGASAPKPAYLAQSDGSWRWAPDLFAWVSPAFDVSWSAGNVIPAFSSPFDGQHVQLYVGDWTVEGRPAIVDPMYAASRSALGVIDSYAPTLQGGPTTAAAAGSGVAFAVQSQGVLPEDDVNLIPNPSFEAGTAGWSAVDGTIAQEDGFTTVVSGTADGASVLVVSGTGGGFSAVTPAGTAGMPVVAGSTYIVSAWMFVRGADTYTVPPGITLAWHDGAGTLLGGGRIAQDDVLDALWNVGDGSVAPPGAAFLQVQLTADSVGAAAFAVDLVRVVKGPGAVAPTAPLADLSVKAMLGTQVAVGATFTYPPADVDGVGVDGDYYLDTRGKALYGPKDDGLWPDDPAVEGFNLTRLVR